MAYSSNTILLNDKKEWSIDTGNMSETNLWVWIRTVAVSGGKKRLIAKKKKPERIYKVIEIIHLLIRVGLHGLMHS